MKQNYIPISRPIIESSEKKAVIKVLESGMLAQGPMVEAFEEEFAKYCGTKYAVAVNSGTAAIHTALYAAGVRAGDEVITTSFSFIATVNPILMLGAKPILVDIEPDTFNIDVSLIVKAISKKTKAVIPVDLYGQPYEYSQLKKVADKHKFTIIEDACQAIGAKYKNKKAGSLGDIACFSLYATKNITSGEGGVITTNNRQYAEVARRFRQHGMNKVGSYEYDHLGYNYRMSDIHASIARQQLKKIDKYTKARQMNAELLSLGLRGVRGIVLPSIAPNRTHVYHQYTISVTDEFPLTRDELVQVLKDEGVASAVYYPKPLYAYQYIESLTGRLNHVNADVASQQVISLPVHPRVREEEIQHIAKLISSIK